MTEPNQTQTQASTDRGLDDGFYDANATNVTMGPSGADGDQVIFDMEIHVEGTKDCVRMSKYNNLSTSAGLQITMSDATVLGLKGFGISKWKTDPTIVFRVILETEEYQGRHTQKIKKILPKRAEYKLEIIAKKSESYEAKLERAHAENIDYQQRKAEGQLAGRGGGRSNEMPREPNNDSARDDFGRGPASQDDFAKPAGNGQPRRDRF